MGSELLAVLVPGARYTPNNLLLPLPRVAGFPATTMLDDSSYSRNTFDYVNLEVKPAVIVPTPRVTLREHQMQAFQEMQQGRVHLGEAWVKDMLDLRRGIRNTDAHGGYYAYYYEGADGPVPDLQESAAITAAGNFTKSYSAGLPVSSEIRQQIYREVVFADYQNPAALLKLAATCRFLRAEATSFHRANCGFAFRHPLMLSRFLECIEPQMFMLKHKENMLTFGCIMIDLRSRLSSCPATTMQICPDVYSKTCQKSCCEAEEGKPANIPQDDVFDKINLDILHLPDSKSNANVRERRKHLDNLRRAGFTQEAISPDDEPNTRVAMHEPTILDWYQPMMRLLRWYKIRKLIVRRAFGTHEALTSIPEMLECLLGFSHKHHTVTTAENVGGWAWHALEYEREENIQIDEEREGCEMGEREKKGLCRGFQKIWQQDEMDEVEKELMRNLRIRFFARK